MGRTRSKYKIFAWNWFRWYGSYYPNYTKDDEHFAHYLIEKYDLVPTGGTDFHGANRPSVELGSGTNNNLDIPYEFYKNICKLIK